MLLFHGHSWHMGPLCIMVDLLELELAHLFCKIAQSTLYASIILSWLDDVLDLMLLLNICY